LRHEVKGAAVQPEPQGITARTTGSAGVTTVAREDRPWLAGLRPAFAARLRGWVSREIEARRPSLWLPVAMMAGITAYFAAETEPNAWAGPSGVVICAILAVVLRNRPARSILLLAAFAFMGFSCAAGRAGRLAAPVLERGYTGTLQGFVETVDPRPGSARILVRATALSDVADEVRPFRVRVSVAGRTSVRPGEHIAAQARLLPPPEASRPGGYAFAREAYFQRIGAIGSLPGAVALAPPPVPVPWDVSLTAAVDRARNALTERIIAVIGGAPGAVAASLVTGKRGMIPDDVNEALRGAGIYHVVSISGLHMVLAAGMAFWIVRALLALVPGLALRHDIRKAAAACAIAAGLAYNVFAGSEIATQRSLIMTAILFGAMLISRSAISMRNLAIAALIVMALEPESVTGPSFQMSFAAVAALIALYERTGADPGKAETGLLAILGRSGGGAPAGAMPWPARGARWCAGLAIGAVLTTLAAEAATGPFSLYHFQRISPYGLIGNALTLPLVSFVVMPMAVIGALAWPFGLDGPAWIAMGIGTDWMLRLSALVAGWSGSTAGLHAFGPGALLLMVGGLVWCVIWITPLRWLGGAPALAGLWLAVQERPPDLFVAPDGRAAAVRGGDGQLVFLGRGPGGFVAEQWLRAAGDPRSSAEALAQRAARCDASGCVSRFADGAALSLVRSPGAFETDCRRAAAIVTDLVAPAWCRPRMLVDKQALAERGAHMAVWNATAHAVKTDRTERTDRPWARKPVKREVDEGESGPEDPVP
jgi:competence protein ComEC